MYWPNSRVASTGSIFRHARWRWVHLDADVRRVVKCAEQRRERHGASRDISRIDVGLPEDSDFVLFARGKYCDS